MATNRPANLPKPLLTPRAVKSKYAYSVIEVSCLDLARILDWCNASTLVTQSGSSIGIRDTVWYRDAYDSIETSLLTSLSRSGGVR